MIDIHTHPCQLQNSDVFNYFEKTGQVQQEVLDSYYDAIKGVAKAVVLAFVAPQSQIINSNEFIAKFVGYAPERLVGFACVDPKSQDALGNLIRVVKEHGFVGVKLAPLYQHFNPLDQDLWPLYHWIQESGLPIMWHQGTSYMAREGPLEYARPFLLDKVAREFPEIKMVIAHFGYPWQNEVVALMRKHENVYTDVSVLAGRKWYLYNALIASIEYGVEDKILLGSDWPAFTTGQTAEALRSLSEITLGTNLPSIPEDTIEAIIERDSFSLLGIPK